MIPASGIPTFAQPKHMSVGRACDLLLSSKMRQRSRNVYDYMYVVK